MRTILGALELRPTFRYEKFRTTYKLPGIRALKLEFDETPIGLFLELEGSASAIDRAARMLGYYQYDYVTESYGALYIADCRRKGRKPAHMVFPRTKNCVIPRFSI
jgi:adenylate cyclase class 2